jgi:hypothetical protein
MRVNNNKIDSDVWEFFLKIPLKNCLFLYSIIWFIKEEFQELGDFSVGPESGKNCW